MTASHDLHRRILEVGVDDWVSLTEVVAFAEQLSADGAAPESLLVDVVLEMAKLNEIIGIGNYPPTDKAWSMEPTDLRRALEQVLDAPRTHMASPYMDDRWLNLMDVWIVTDGSSSTSADG